MPGSNTTPDTDAVSAAADLASENLRIEDKKAIIAGVIQLIGTAATTPGGTNFTQATASLNDYFRYTPPALMAMSEPMRAYLAENAGQFPIPAAGVIDSKRFDVRWDGLYIEDCLLMRDIAAAVLARGAKGETDVDRARRLFDYVVRQVQLVPPGALADPSLTRPDGSPAHVPARPHDVVVRGMATDIEGGWAERSWLFLSLCRQARLDAAYLALILPRTVLSRGTQGPLVDRAGLQRVLRPANDLDISFACGVAIDGQVYLFDARLGTPIFAPDGSVATLEQAASDAAILAALDLPDEPYPIRASGLRSGRIRVLLDAPHCSLAPRMKLLQDDLTGDRRMVLFRDPTELSAVFHKAVGPRLDGVRLWSLPLQVEFSQFNDPSYNRFVLYPLRYFDPKLPLLNARLSQLRGELPQAIKEYVNFRLNPDAVMVDGKTLIPSPVQEVLTAYATYFLALAQQDLGESTTEDAQFLFRETLRLLPEPGPSRPIHFMFRWGAQANLARMLAGAGRPEEAVRYATLSDPTGQGEGNRLFARSLFWSNPFPPEADVPLPPEPPSFRTPGRSPRRAQPAGA
jgi:hypothetical protein